MVKNISKYFNDFKAFVEYAIDMDDIYKDIEEYNQIRKIKYKLFMI